MQQFMEAIDRQVSGLAEDTIIIDGFKIEREASHGIISFDKEEIKVFNALNLYIPIAVGTALKPFVVYLNEIGYKEAIAEDYEAYAL